MFGGIITRKEWREGRKWYKRAQKVIKGKTDREEAVKVITYNYLLELHSLEGHLFKQKDSLLKALREHDEDQKDLDKWISDEWVDKDIIRLMAKDFDLKITPWTIAADNYRDRFLTYLVDHYMRVTYHIDRDFPVLSLPYDELWHDIESSDYFDECWDLIIKEDEESRKNHGDTSDPRIFKPERNCISRYYDFLSGIHSREDKDFMLGPAYSKYGDPLFVGKEICVSRAVFGDDAPEKYGLPDERYITAAMPRLDFHGVFDSDTIDHSMDTADEYNTYLTWEPELISRYEMVLKCGDIVDRHECEGIDPSKIADL